MTRYRPARRAKSSTVRRWLSRLLPASHKTMWIRLGGTWARSTYCFLFPLMVAYRLVFRLFSPIDEAETLYSREFLRIISDQCRTPAGGGSSNQQIHRPD